MTCDCAGNINCDGEKDKQDKGVEMIKDLNRTLKKYTDMQKMNFEHVNIAEVVNDLSRLIWEIRIKRLPKHLR